jgi:hypothetical protein
VYVFLAMPHGTDREARRRELLLRMFVALGRFKAAHPVVGIATEQYEKGRGHSLDLSLLKRNSWTDEDQARMEEMQRELGYFTNPKFSRMSEDEYPTDLPSGGGPTA